MKALEALQTELEKEAHTSRKMLQRIPDDQYSWRPHPKSMVVKTLANHIAELPGWIGMTLNSDEMDFAVNPYTPSSYTKTADLLDHFEKVMAQGRQDLLHAREEQLTQIWTLRNGEIIYTSDTKWEMLRMTISQIIHHRAQLGVYLRLLDIPIPGSYGPSADED